MDFWISKWISGFLDFRLDFWISNWISADSVASFPGPAQLSVAISTVSVLQATKSWAGPGNEATDSVRDFSRDGPLASSSV